MTNTTRISMWSGPRNISTTMMRAFENRPDTRVFDEPLYGAYLASSGAAHPYREETLASQPNTWQGAIAALDAPLPPSKSLQFEKHIAYHYPLSEPLDWLLSRRVLLLVRDPALMVASYARKLNDVAPIVESYRVARRIFDYLSERRRLCIVLDSADVLADPPSMISALCNALGIPFIEQMLSWPSGLRDSDGVWGPHWYDAVYKSTGFIRADPERRPPELSDDLAAIAQACRPDYDFLQQYRLRT